MSKALFQMKKGLSLFAVLVFILAVSSLILVSKNEQKLVSVLGVSGNFSEDIWYPKDASGFGEISLPVTSKAAFFIDNISGEALYSKNSKQKLPIASLVKIMTAIVALEHKSFKDIYTVSKKAAETEPDSMLLMHNEKLTLEELLSGIFLVSANDAAEVLAEGTLRQAQGEQGSREEFINMMNSKAKQLGMVDSLFINPTGLEEDGREQYSTVYDVVVMSHYLIKKWPKILEISSKPHIYIPRTLLHQDYDLYSGINLLTTYPGVLGLKTGFTYEAGLTLVTLAQREGREVLGVILGSENRRDEARTLLDYSFEKLGVDVDVLKNIPQSGRI